MTAVLFCQNHHSNVIAKFLEDIKLLFIYNKYSIK